MICFVLLCNPPSNIPPVGPSVMRLVVASQCGVVVIEMCGWSELLWTGHICDLNFEQSIIEE